MSKRFERQYGQRGVLVERVRGIFLDWGTTVPTVGTSGYAVGAIFINPAGAVGTALYANEGSATSCDFKALPTNAATVAYGDDQILHLGTSLDESLVHNSAGLTANTTLANVIVGTPVVGVIPADSLLVTNITADGDQVFIGQTGGNSHEWLRYDSSARVTLMREPVVIGAVAQVVISNGDGTTAATPAEQVLGTTKSLSSMLLGTFSATARPWTS